MAFGPIQILAVGFPTTDQFEGRIAEELIKLSDAGTINIGQIFIKVDRELSEHLP